jgi:hypothetical protein
MGKHSEESLDVILSKRLQQFSVRSREAVGNVVNQSENCLAF